MSRPRVRREEMKNNGYGVKQSFAVSRMTAITSRRSIFWKTRTRKERYLYWYLRPIDNVWNTELTAKLAVNQNQRLADEH